MSAPSGWALWFACFPVAGLNGTEQLDGLVYQVGAEVVEDAAPVSEVGSIAPVPEPLRPPPLKARFEGADVTQGALTYELLERQEVGVPPAVLEHRQLHTGVGRAGDELITVGRCGDERLVHHHVEAMGYCRSGQVEVGERGSAQDDEVKVGGQGEHCLRRGNDPGMRVAPGRLGGPFRVRRHDHVEGVGGISRDQRCVENPARDSEADDGGPDGCRCFGPHQSTSERKRCRRSLWGLSNNSAGVPDSTTSPSSMKTT